MFKRLKTFKRYRTIVSVLVKHGFHEFVEKTKLARYLRFKKEILTDARYPRDHEVQGTRWRRIRLALEELGPAFVKLGQFMSNRPDLLPQDLCRELQFLLDAVPPFDSGEAKHIVENELGSSLDDLFIHFSETPISSASIAQVHQAVLKDGSQVAVKVQRPGIAKIIESDLAIMRNIAQMLEKSVAGIKLFNPVGIVDEFAQAINNEIDFNFEATNIERLYEDFAGNNSTHVPKVNREFSTSRVLVMEYIAGTKLSDICGGTADVPDKVSIADRIADLFMIQVFENNFFHADPHPGNIIVMDGGMVCFIDLGLMGAILPRTKDLLSSFLIGLVKRDSRKVATAVLSLAAGQQEAIDRTQFEFDILKVMEKYGYQSLRHINLGKFFNEILKLMMKYKLKVPPDLYLLIKAFISIEGIARALNPDFDMIGHVQPYMKKLVYENISPKRIMGDLADSIQDYARLFYDIPSELREIFSQLKNRNFKIQFEHKGLEPMLKKHDQISNRVSYSIITASMIIGSSLILAAGVAPKIHNISILGAAIFVFSVIMGIFLLVTILRHGRM